MITCQEPNCGKLAALGKVLCPHHQLLHDEELLEVERRKERSAKARARRKALRDALPESPLAAYNPEYDQKRRSHD